MPLHVLEHYSNRILLSSFVICQESLVAIVCPPVNNNDKSKGKNMKLSLSDSSSRMNQKCTFVEEGKIKLIEFAWLY